MGRSPKYTNIVDKIHKMIREYSYEQKLPTETELTKMFNVSRQTIRMALEQLRQDGVIKSLRGSGSYYIGGGSNVPENITIAVITTYISDYIFPSILCGIEEIARSNSFPLQLYATENDTSIERKILSLLLKIPIHGLIVEATKSNLPNPNLDYYLRMADAGIPIVFINGFYSNLNHKNIIHIVMDDFTGGQYAAQRLIGDGHKEIGGIFKIDDMQGVQRYTGYVRALSENGYSFDNQHIIWFTTETKGSSLSMEIPKLLLSCSAIVCYNDEIALETVNCAKQEKDCLTTAVVSFDRVFDYMPTEINFYSLLHPKAELGETAMNKLISMIKGHPEESIKMQWYYD